MADFKNVKEILDTFNLSFKFEKFFDINTVPRKKLNPYFLKNLDFALANRGQTDKEFFISEFIVVPFLREAWQNHVKVTLFSHPNLKVKDFNLYPDYLIGGKDKTGLKILQKPLLLTIEAKDEKIEQGWFEALQQLVAARLMNNDDNITIHAIVTTGDLWYFGKLEKGVFIRHPIPVGITQPNLLMSVIEHVFDECEKYV